jgi:PGF-pre-PGF domain-containing protein
MGLNMREIKSNKVPRVHNFLKVSGTALMALIMLINVVGAESSSNITFVTTGSSFSPIITITGNATIQWTFGDGTTSNSAAPRKNFGSAGTRTNTLVVTPWSAVTKINIGYDGSDEGVLPSSSTIARLNQQNVIAVTGLENVAPSLQIWASSYNPITSLDFSNFIALNTIECFYCRSLDTIKLHNVPALKRLCLEHCNISYLDISEAPSLADIRASSQQGSTYTINWGTTGANIWHICIRDNPQITSTFPFNQFPILKDFYNWNDNQSGTLHLTSTSLRRVLSSNNHYSAAVLSGCFPEGQRELNIHDNNLKSLDISNDPGLLNLDASRNSLNQTAVDGVLQTLDSYNTEGGALDLTGNAAPSNAGIAHANNLTTRDWEVKIPSQNNPPTANFTSNVTSGKVPLAVQFNDTSSGNPTSRSWEFGDGTYSTEKFPEHVYTSPGNYKVTLAVRNSNSADFKDSLITVLNKDSSNGDSSGDDSSGSGSSHSSGGSGGAGGSPEPQSNVHVKELSQAFVNNGKSVKFDFPRNATPVVYVIFDSKKTAGKITTIVEMLKEKSTLVSALPSDEVYKYLNIWVGNAGFATSNNIGNAVVYFKVEKSWIQNKNIDKPSITLNRYTDKKWDTLPTSLSDEDNKYLYFTAKTPGFSPFAVTGKNTSIVTEIEPATGNITPNVEQTPEKIPGSSEKGNTGIPGFDMVCGIVSVLAVFLHKRK